MSNERDWDEEKVTCYASENGGVFYGVIGVTRHVVDFILFGSTIQNLRAKMLIL
jgi:hypothetical protein